MKYIVSRGYAILVCILLLKTIDFVVNHVLITRLGGASFVYQLSSRWGVIIFILHWKQTYDAKPNYYILIAIIMTQKF